MPSPGDEGCMHTGQQPRRLNLGALRCRSRRGFLSSHRRHVIRELMEEQLPQALHPRSVMSV